MIIGEFHLTTKKQNDKQMKNRIFTFIKEFRAFVGKPIVKKMSLLIIGFTSTVWFLVRVIPKPSRATYPCMQAAAPMMSGFVVWLLALFGTSFAFKKARQRWLESRYFVAGIF